MRIKFIAFVLLVIPCFLQAQNLFDNHHSSYKIVIPAAATEEEKLAAGELQHYLLQCSGAELPVIYESMVLKSDSLLLWVGKTYRSVREIPAPLVDSLYADGFMVYASHSNLFFYGNAPKSCLYAVYDFLENELGFRLYTPDALCVPSLQSYRITSFCRIENPSFSYRETLYYYPNHSRLYADWHHLQNREDIGREWGMFVHTFQHLVPVDKYFDAHPEWFSEIKGQRVRDGQLCLSNPDVLDILCKNLADRMKENPEADIWSVSNNDNYNNCTCDKCRHLDSLYGAPSGTLIHFVNQVAARFPGKTISTLAYQYTRSAPTRNIKPADNVNIMFCSIECGRQEAIATVPAEASFRKDMKDWSRLTHNIFLWDYVGQFRNMMNPFPNLHVLQPNLQFFRQNGVDMMFEQGTGANNVTSWMELRTYLLAKLMWNVNADGDAIISDFCKGYYGPAAESVMKFYKEMETSLVASGKRLDIYGYAIDGKDGYLSPKQIDKYQQLIAGAYGEVKGNAKLTDRVRYLELSLDYAILELAMHELSPEISYFTFNQEGNKVLNEQMLSKLENFLRDCHRFGVNNLEENGYTPEEFIENIEHYIDKQSRRNLAFQKSVTLTPACSPLYSAGNSSVLTDGRTGALNYSHRWLGFEGSDMEAVVDLEELQTVHELSVDFYFYPLSWIFLPSKVEFFVSNNGTKWIKLGEQSGENPQILAKAMIKTYSVANVKTRARYVKIVAHSLHVNPDWHRGAGQPCWIFADEIFVR